MVAPRPSARLATAVLVGSSLLTSVAAQFHTSWPSERRGHAFVDDAARGVSVLFGGRAGAALLSDTWDYYCGTWVRRSPTQALPARADASRTSFERRSCEVVCAADGPLAGGR